MSSLPIKLDFNPQSHREGIATYFRSHLQKYVSNWIKKNPKDDGSLYNLYLDGLRIYTTIDSRLQNYAEQAVTSHMKNLQREFFNQNQIEQNPTAPFLDITDAEIEKIIRDQAIAISKELEGNPSSKEKISEEKEDK